MTAPLDPLLADGVIDEVLARLKSGKEADIYLVRSGLEVLAAKVYKDAHVRSFQNNAAYKEGRAVRNSRTQRAMAKGSRFGRGAEEDAWKTKEADALETLFAAGVRVPKPHLFYEGVLLMEAVSDAEGHPAPRLIDAGIPRERAAELYADLRGQIVSILRCDLIHGDLSPYNVLLAWTGPTIIDFPQVIGAAHNSQAESFFRRDLEGIHRFFAQIDPALEVRAGDAHEIWRAYVRRELSAGFVPSGRSEPRGQTGRGEGRGEGRGQRPDPRRGGAPAGSTDHRTRSGGDSRPSQRLARPPRPGAEGGPPNRPDRPSAQRPAQPPRHPQPESGRPEQAPRQHRGPPRRPTPAASASGQAPKPLRQPGSWTQPGPVVSYVGQVQPVTPQTPGQPGPSQRRRRRRGRGGGKKPTP